MTASPTYATYLPELQAEYDWWMQGSEVVRPGQASRHVVRTGGWHGAEPLLGRKAGPARRILQGGRGDCGHVEPAARVVWRNLRAAAESGWDFSARWLADGRTLATVRTLDLLPPDLNSLLAQLERTLAQAYSLKGDAENSAVYAARAHVCTEAI